MDDKQTAHAMGIDDTYRVERTLARGQGGVTELVSIDGIGPFVRKKIPSQLAQRMGGSQRLHEPTPATRRGNIRVARSFRGGV